MALYNAAQVSEILNGAPAVDPNMIFNAMGGEAYYGIEAVNTYNNMWYTYENAPGLYRELYLNPYLDAWQAGGGAVTPTATEALVPQAVVNSNTGVVEGTKAVRMPATTTPVGNVKAGALAGRVPIGTLIAGTAIGAGIGLKEVATHPKFWNDLSDAVFNDIKNPDTYIAKPLAETETANVIWRCLEDGSIQGYCDKRDIDAVINRLYQFDAFNVADHFDPEIITPGRQHVDVNSINSGYLMEIAKEAGYGEYPVIAGFYSAVMARYPQTTVAEFSVVPNGAGAFNVGMKCYNLTSGTYDVSYITGTPNIAIPNESKIGTATATINRGTGEIGSIQWNDGYVAGTTIRSNVTITTGEFGNTGITSNMGTLMVPKNPNVIYNGTDQLPPSDPADFWQTFATWLANAFSVTAYNPLTNANETVTYLPFTAPENNWQVEDITGNQQGIWQGLYDFVSPFTNPTTDPINNPSPWIFESIGNFTIPKTDTPQPTPWDNNPKFPQPTPTPVGSTPTIAVPTSGVSSGNKLYTVYNPTQAEVDNLGAYLWTQNIVELIAQFFQNPLDAIISLHMIYCTPSTGSAKNIMLGYLNSGVTAAVVTSQYEDIPCGYVDIPEFYGNALDYTGVAIQVFLPFIGYRVLKTKEVMGRRLEVDYKVDVYTGTCLAFLYVISANTRQLLYTFEGNCSVQIPLTAADRTRLIAGITTAGLSAFTGNPAGVVGGIASIGANIERSGSFSGNAGAMNVKKPFVVITRAINAQASHYNTLYGYPLNKYGYLRNFRGYTRVQSVHVDIPGATDREKAMIESALKSGIKI